MVNIFSRPKKTSMRLEEVTKQLSQLKIPLSYVFTPINLKVEKEKFLQSDTYEPQFQYRVVKNHNEEILKNLSSLKEISDVDPRISDFYIELIESKRDSSDLMHAVGNNDLVSELSYKKYGKPSAPLFRNASRVLRGKVDSYKLVDRKRVKGEDLLKYDEIKDAFLVVFKSFGLDDWSVAKSGNIAKGGAKVGIKRREVFLDPDIERTKFKLKKTLVHEVGTHVLRAVNGMNSGFEALSKPTLPSYLDVEEGLAAWNESEMGLLTLRSLKEKAALLWAVYIGESLTFRELYNSLLGIFPKYTAFSITYRVKRGLGDTSYHGIFAKDVVYFRGFRRVKRRLERDKSLYEKLYAGKINFKQCEWVDTGLIPKAKIVPNKDMWVRIFRDAGL
ncbi:MAG: tyrosine/phenylalanine carboxypeptidase domain-containing protein [Candidatus Dojkabacteria bacterium]